MYVYCTTAKNMTSLYTYVYMHVNVQTLFFFLILIILLPRPPLTMKKGRIYKNMYSSAMGRIINQ